MQIRETKDLEVLLSYKYKNTESYWAKTFATELEKDGKAERNLGSRGKYLNEYFQAIKIGETYYFRFTAQSSWPSWKWTEEFKEVN